MHIASLSSSSRGGNAYLVWGKSFRPILIDCGISLRKLTRSLDALGMEPPDIQALFVTHEHSDHVKCLCLKNPVAKKYDFPVYASRGFWQWYFSNPCRRLPSNLVNSVSSGSTVFLEGAKVKALAKPHDAREPLAFVVESGGERTAVVMDLGFLPDSLSEELFGIQTFIFESNHDVGMEMRSGRPGYLVDRVLGNYGHLSNAQAGEALSKITDSGTDRIILAHLSEDCNTPEMAKKTVISYLMKKGLAPTVDVAPSREMKVFS